MNSEAPRRTLKQRFYDTYKKMTGGFAKVEPSGFNADKPKTKKLLYIFSCGPNAIVNVQQTVFELVRLSSYQYDLLNLYGYLPISPDIHYGDYDGVVIHNNISFSTDILYRIESLRKQRLSDYAGLKVMLKQDENIRTNEIAQYVGANGFDLLVTLASPKWVRSFYPEAVVGKKLAFLHALTGYVPESYHSLPYSSEGARSLDVGYRGSIQDDVFGRIGYEKRSIGYDFLPHARRRGLVTDISSRWEDRINGTAWLDFLAQSKGTLGVESGTDVVDVDGRAGQALLAYKKQNPNATDAELLKVMEPFENIPYRTISPRHFEAAACFTAQILFEGEYQGIFLPNHHYIPLKRDFSNVDEVIDRLLDDGERRQMTRRAFEEIVLNPEYSFETYVKRFDQSLDACFGAGA